MPVTKYAKAVINNMEVDFTDIDQSDIELSFKVNEPENWSDVQSAGASLTFPATTRNDQVFNTFWNPEVEDMSQGQQFRNLMSAIFYVNGTIPVIKGQFLLQSASFTDKPEKYAGIMIGGNGSWIVDAENLTLWDCLNTTPHTFNVATVEASWQATNAGGYDSDEFHDYVYAPVRYRQPFQYTDLAGNQRGSDDQCTIYHLRPSISKYWLIIRGFRQLGFTVSSQFLNTAFFRRQTMPWTWGDFFDINSQLTDGIAFKAAGDIQDMLQNEPPGASIANVWCGSGTPTLAPSAHGTLYRNHHMIGGLTAGGAIDPAFTGNYIFTGDADPNNNFRLTNTLPPNGFDNFNLYAFDDTTGTMSWTYKPPASIASFVGNNITVNFQLNLILTIGCNSGEQGIVALETKHYNSGGTLLSTTNESIMPYGNVSGATTYPSITTVYPLNPTVYNFSKSGINQGDTLKFRLRGLEHSATAPGIDVLLFQSMLRNVNPSATGANAWQLNPLTEQWKYNYNGDPSPTWQQEFSYLQMTGLQIEIGGAVNFRYYDAFRNEKFLDYLGGIVDEFNLMMTTDPTTNTVYIEPALPVTVPDFDATGAYTADIQLNGYWNTAKVNDWTDKLDLTKENVVENFNQSNRQIDFNHKQDGSDGGCNIWSARYKGIYLNNVIRPTINNTNIDNGIIAGVPGASRYMLPNRFAKGNVQKQNRFFSTCMHYRHTKWKGLLGGALGPAPQLICIFPENINDSSASAITQTFEPKTAFYAGLRGKADFGTWRWMGDPQGRGVDGAGIGIPTYNDVATVISGTANGVPYTQPLSANGASNFDLPFMFGVNYNNTLGVDNDKYPVLSYCDQLVYNSGQFSVVAPGLMRKFHLPRLALMRNGQLCRYNLRLNLNDICQWGQPFGVRIGNSLYLVLEISGYKPLSDDSCEVTLWRFANMMQTDIDNSFPSQTTILTSPAILPQYDLRYAQLLLFMSDIPEV